MGLHGEGDDIRPQAAGSADQEKQVTNHPDCSCSCRKEELLPQEAALSPLPVALCLLPSRGTPSQGIPPSSPEEQLARSPGGLSLGLRL